jgi:hsp70-interacting protein
LQNNPKSQTALLALDPLPKLIELLQSDPSSELRSKAIYTISGLLRHNSSALTRFTELNGWGALTSALKDPSISLRRKAAFLVHSLFINSTSPEEAVSYNEAAQKAGIHSTLLDSLSKKTALPVGENGEIEDIDVDYSDKAVNALVSITDRAGQGKVDKVFTSSQKTQLKSLLEELEKEDRIPTDLSKEEWNSFADAVKKA